jgi:hypothetical protein
MSDYDIIKVEIPVSRKDLKVLASPGQKVASRDQIRELVAQLYRVEVATRRLQQKGGAK